LATIVTLIGKTVDCGNLEGAAKKAAALSNQERAVGSYYYSLYYILLQVEIEKVV